MGGGHIPRRRERSNNLVTHPHRLHVVSPLDDNTSELVAHDEAGFRGLVAAKDMKLAGQIGRGLCQFVCPQGRDRDRYN